MSKTIDIKGQTFGYWKVNERLDNKQYDCTCLLCNNHFNVSSYKLRNGLTHACRKCSAKKVGEEQREKLDGTVINDWTILEYLGQGRYKCRCKCNNIREIDAYQLKNNKTHRCEECNARLKQDINREKLEGTQIGELYIAEYLGDSRYRCICSCNNEYFTTTYLLKTNKYHMCKECFEKIKSNIYRESMYNKYGDISSMKIKSPREDWQIELINDKEKLINYINRLSDEKGRLPTSYELSQKLDISIHILLTYTRQYGINLYTNKMISNGELELRDFVESFGYKALYNNKTAIHPNELDIYIPEKKLAIEFNGTYWHSSEQKSKNYHQEKTITCAKQGIQLIHIFEYEWNNEVKQKQIKNILINKLDNSNYTRVYARNTKVVELESNDTIEFLNKNHIQGYTQALINFGLIYKDELIAIITFGKPRFNNNYEYELVRLAFKNDYLVIGGSEKLFKHFIQLYNPTSVISYCDITKFNGNVYTKLGFKTSPKNITKPNYIWVNPIKNEILTRYQTQKQKLIKYGLGTEDETEDEIMTKYNYLKVYDSGNLKFIWLKET